MLDIKALITTFRRRLNVFIAIFLTVFALVLIITLQSTPLYKSTAHVIIDPQENDTPNVEALLSGRPPDSALVDTEVEIVKSRALTENVIKTLDLTNDPEFNSSLREASIFENVKSTIKSLVSGADKAQGNPELAERIQKESVTNAVLNKLNVRREGVTLILKISMKSESPLKAAKIANTYAEQYLVEQLNAKFNNISRSNAWLDKRLADLREDVLASESAVERYRAESGLFSAEGTSLTEQQISDLNAQLIIHRAELDDARARLDSVKIQAQKGESLESIAEVLSSDVIRDLRRTQAEITGKQAELSARYGARHPEILKIEREAADNATQIRQEVQRIVSNLEREVNRSRRKLSSTESSLNSLRRELASNNKALVRLRDLQRIARSNKTLYENVLNQFKEAGEKETITQADARIVSAASVPIYADSPKLRLSLAIAIVLGTMFATACILLLELFDTKITTVKHIENLTDIPLVTSIPLITPSLLQKFSRAIKMRGELHDLVVEKPLSRFSESFRTLRSSIILSNIGKKNKVVSILSASPGVGKTTVTICLGRLSAMSGAKTLIVDCDLRRRNLSHLLLKKVDKGLIECLSKDASLKEAILKDPKTSCHVLPLAEMQFTPKDIFGSDAFAELLKKLRSNYDLVILDTAPILAVAESRTLASISDTVVPLVKWHETRKEVLRSVLKILDDINANVSGIAMTQINEKASRRYGYGEYGYYDTANNSYYQD